VEPVRVKVYGLIPLTRRRYLGQVAVTTALGAVLLVVWWLRWPAFRHQLRQIPLPVAEWVVAVGDNLPWVLLAGAAVQGVEAYFALRRFARKQAPSTQQAVAQP